MKNLQFLTPVCTIFRCYSRAREQELCWESLGTTVFEISRICYYSKLSPARISDEVIPPQVRSINMYINFLGWKKKLSIVHQFQGNHFSVNHHRGRKILPFNLFHSNISTHILHTGLLTFPEALTRRICLTIKSFFSW